ncbi:MAG: ATP-binding protein [Clostridia bacterium]
MNIREAKEQIKNAVRAYLQKDEYGAYCFPRRRQRPVFLLGAPGVGKTAVLEQIAGELGIGLVSYSMIHHTRQSALGLPYIVKKNYGGKEFSVSEYTMSEIIASVYAMMETTGVREGILFLDEVNCVSETLAPAMLQFLQFKTFGSHALPEGWIIVTAGNPPEYNRSVREFDIATLDRLKVLEVEADFEAWKEYAYEQNVHPAVISYLSVKRGDFCAVETTVEGKSFVTPRGWDDLSEMMKEYEACGIEVEEGLIGQYVRNRRIAKDFYVYYELYRKYRSDYQVDAILRGSSDSSVTERAKNASFDERISLIGLILSSLLREVSVVTERERVLRLVAGAVKAAAAAEDGNATLTAQCDEMERKLAAAKKSSSLKEEERSGLERAVCILRRKQAEYTGDPAAVKASLKQDLGDLAGEIRWVKEAFDHVFSFAEEAFGEGKEMLVLVTELTVSRDAVDFISRYGCEGYFAHNKELLFHDRRREIDRALEAMDLS